MFLSLQNKENQAYKPSLVYFVFSHFLGSLQKNDLFVEPKIFISTAHILASFLLFLFMDFVQKEVSQELGVRNLPPTSFALLPLRHPLPPAPNLGPCSRGWGRGVRWLIHPHVAGQVGSWGWAMDSRQGWGCQGMPGPAYTCPACSFPATQTLPF